MVDIFNVIQVSRFFRKQVLFCNAFPSPEKKVKIARMIQGGENFGEVLQPKQMQNSTSASVDSPEI
jgi:hypothetical protein